MMNSAGTGTHSDGKTYHPVHRIAVASSAYEYH